MFSLQTGCHTRLVVVSQTPHPIHQQILPSFPLKYIRNPIIPICYHPCHHPTWSRHHPSPRLLAFGLVTLLLPVLLAAYSNIAARVNLEKLKSSRWHSSAGDPPMARTVKVTVLLMTWDACVLWPLLPFGPYFLPFPPLLFLPHWPSSVP